ncbi:MAG: DUF2383 domain-containing protein [Lachnospiraceae bacterium]
MNTNLLNEIYQNAEMGRNTLMSVIKRTDDTNFRIVLEEQLTEYEKIFDQADQMIKEGGAQPTEGSGFSKMTSEVMASLKTMANSSPEYLAKMIVQGSTMGVTNITKAINDNQETDKKYLSLAKALLKTEENNIEEMKKFL